VPRTRKHRFWEVRIRGSRPCRVRSKTWMGAVYRARKLLKLNTRESTPEGEFAGVSCELLPNQYA
jgi:hypothetical protein